MSPCCCCCGGFLAGRARFYARRGWCAFLHGYSIFLSKVASFWLGWGRAACDLRRRRLKNFAQARAELHSIESFQYLYFPGYPALTQDQSSCAATLLAFL